MFRRIPKRALVAALTTALLIGVAPTSVFGAVDEPASLQASAGMRPDAWVRYTAYTVYSKTYKHPSPWVGDNIYNATGRKQTETESAGGWYEPGGYFTFQVAIENDGAADRFTLRADGTGSSRVKYFRGSTNITSAVVNGTYQTPEVAPGATFVIKVRIVLDGAAVERLVKATSVADPGKADTVRIRVVYTGCSC